MTIIGTGSPDVPIPMSPKHRNIIGTGGRIYTAPVLS
jgi:hypothetical protein